VATVPLAWNSKADVSFDQLQLLAVTRFWFEIPLGLVPGEPNVS
jgi:hypothetical protein